MYRLKRVQIALSHKLNSTSVTATSTSLEERTKISLEDAAQTRLGLLWHHIPQFDLANDIPRGGLQLVVGGIHSLLMLLAM
jgi:hypothetical protein